MRRQNCFTTELIKKPQSSYSMLEMMTLAPRGPRLVVQPGLSLMGQPANEGAD